MATYVTPKRGVEFIFYVSLVSQSNTKVFQADPTLAAGDVKVSLDGGAEANITTLPAATPAGSKRVKVTLSAAEMTADNVQVTFSDAAGSEWCDLTVNIQTSARQIDDLATQTSVNTIDDFLDTEVAAIKAVTDLLPDAGALTSLATQASVNTIDDLLDTEIAALTTELAKVPKSDGTVIWNATALAAIQSEATDALVAYDPPTKAELDAADDAVLAAIAGLNDIAATDIVSGGAITTSGGAVSTVTNLTTKTGFKLASDGLDLVVPSDPSAIPVLGTASIVSWIGFFGLWSVGEVNSDSNSVNLRNSADTADLATYTTADDGSVFSSSEPS